MTFPYSYYQFTAYLKPNSVELCNERRITNPKTLRGKLLSPKASVFDYN